MSKKLREAVSKEKRRYHINGFDLDLSYVLNNVIAMGFPSENVEAAYRNPYKDVYRFLESFHKDHYKVYNLCSERGYDPVKFHNRFSHYPFDDHNAPPFEMVERFCKDVNEWVKADPKNIAVVHCKAGKGRTGLMICAYMIWTREWETADEALAFYAAIRTYNKKGVTIPSQIRYVHYTEDWLRRDIQYSRPSPLFANRITLRPRPKLPEGAEISFQLYVAQTLVFKSKPEEHGKAAARALETQRSEITTLARETSAAGDRQMDILKSEAIEHLKQAMSEGGENEDDFSGFEFLTAFANRCRDQGGEWGEWGDEPVSFDLPAVPLCGDILLECYSHGKLGATDHLFSVWFNTAFIRNKRAVFTKYELDKAQKDKKFFAPHFTCELQFSDGNNNNPTPNSETVTPNECGSPRLGHGAQALHERLFQPIATVGGAAELPRTCSTPVPLNLSLVNNNNQSQNQSQKGPIEVVTSLLERMIKVYLRCGYLGTVLDDGVSNVTKHPDFESIHRATSELDNVDLALLKTHEERLAFWLNVHNLMALHATAIENWRRDPTGPLCTTLKEWVGVTQEARYSIGHMQFTLHEIAHCVLRSGLPAPDHGVTLSVAPFKEGDPRKRFIIETHDNHIPYVLANCTTSSPRVFVFHPPTINEELDSATELFLSSGNLVPFNNNNKDTPLPKGTSVFLPKYCTWYSKDFSKKREQLEFFGKILHIPNFATDCDIKYNEHDWEIRVLLDHLSSSQFVITHKIPHSNSVFIPPQPSSAPPTPPSTTNTPPSTTTATATTPPSTTTTTTPEKEKKKHHHHKHHDKEKEKSPKDEKESPKEDKKDTN